MARDRKRAKQRRDRRVREGAGTPAPSQPVRSELPGALDHASADVDEFEAALLRGADGVPAPEQAPEPPSDHEAGGEDEIQEDPSALDGTAAASAGGVEARPSGAPLRGGNRAVGFLRASWAELQRVQWPDRRQVTQATAVVLGFVVVAGLYLGLADFVAKELVEFIL